MTPWEFALVALGAYRLWRIVARDSITEKAREKLTGFDDDHAPPLEAAYEPQADLEVTNDATIWEYAPRRPSFSWRVRVYLSALIRCPWCSGFYIAVAAYVAWRVAPGITIVAATPLALSAVLGIIRKNLDQKE